MDQLLGRPNIAEDIHVLKIFVVSLKFKFNYLLCIFTCCIWQPWVGLIGIERGGSSGREAGRTMPGHGDSREARPLALGWPQWGPGKKLWASSWSSVSLEGRGRAQQLQKEALESTCKQFRLLWGAANGGEDRLRVATWVMCKCSRLACLPQA